MATRTIKASGGDFSTLSAWLASLPTTLTEPEIAVLSAFDLVDQVLINKTTSAANYIEIKAAAGDEATGVWNNAKARVRNSTSGGTGTIRFSSAHLRISGIQVYQESANSGNSGPIECLSSVAGSDVRLDNLVLRDEMPSGANYTLNLAKTNLNFTARNVVCYGKTRSADTRNAASGKIYNCTFWSTQGDLGVLATSAVDIRNTYVGGLAAGDRFWSGGTPTGSNNASSDTTATARFGAGSLNSVAGSAAFTSVTAGSENFSLLSNSPLLNSGTTISGLTSDIVGVTRPQGAAYDIGAFEFASGGGGDTTNPTMTGSITIGTVTQTSIQMSWSAGSDNVAVTSYEVSSNGGTSWADVGNVLTHTFSGLTAGTTYQLRVRAKDAAGNVSAALSASQATNSPPSTATISGAVTNNTGTLLANTTFPKVAFLRLSDMALVLSLTNQTSNGSGVLLTTNAALVAGVTYLRVLSNDAGTNVGIATFIAS